MAEATFAAGCFWGVEEAFRQVPGVLVTAVGYMGGTRRDPTWRTVATGLTGHAEVVHLDYDPARVRYEQLLDVFWGCHDPTSLNRQGSDIGPQYRSAIFTHSPEQDAAARAAKRARQESGRYPRLLVTAIEPAGTFWRAEELHQRYYEKRRLAI